MVIPLINVEARFAYVVIRSSFHVVWSVIVVVAKVLESKVPPLALISLVPVLICCSSTVERSLVVVLMDYKHFTFLLFSMINLFSQILC